MNDKRDKIVLDSLIARQIVKEVMDFGVTQDQILKICKFLAYELENIGIMKEIAETVDKHIDDIDIIDNDMNDSTLEKKDKLITEF